MAITKAEIITAVEADIAANEIKLSSLMSTGSMSNTTEELQMESYTRSLCLLNETKTWVENNL